TSVVMASLSSDSRLVGGASEAVDQLVLQYLDEAGYSSSFAALQAETRTPYARGALAPAQLRRLCCALQQLDEKDEASVQAVRKIDGGAFAQRSTKTITNLHSVTIAILLTTPQVVLPETIPYP
ncbi:MAG: hypothetical protein SGPRY_007862, partial [Prymnesium sp.]